MQIPTTEKRERNASLDVLRVLVMFMIVMGHCIGHGGVSEALADTFSINYVISKVCIAFFNVHVNCFVLVSGYFLCTSQFKLKKWIKLWLDAFFWSVLLYVLTSVFGGDEFTFSIKELIRACLPFTQERYWFVTTYLLMYLLSPICNFAIHAMNKQQHLTCILTYFSVFIVLQNLVFWREFTHVGIHDPLFFLFLYFVAAYFRLYPPKKKHPWILGYVLSSGYVACWTTGVSIVTTNLFGTPIGETAFSHYSSITMVVGSVCLFMTFAQIHITGWIAKAAIAISPLTFGIYLIHDNNQIRTLLWQILIKPYQYANSPWMALIVLGISVGVFAVCASIEWGRLNLFEILRINKFLEKGEKYILAMANHIIDKLLKL